MSVSAAAFAYSVGLMKPTGPLPFSARSELMSVMTAAHSGAASEVPYQW